MSTYKAKQQNWTPQNAVAPATFFWMTTEGGRKVGAQPFYHCLLVGARVSNSPSTHGTGPWAR